MNSSDQPEQRHILQKRSPRCESCQHTCPCSSQCKCKYCCQRNISSAIFDDNSRLRPNKSGTNMGSADIYRERILDYYRNPSNFGKIESPDIAHKESNPLCGDEIEIHVKLDDDKVQVKDIKFTGKGCAISQASASMLTEMVMGKSLEDIKNVGKEDILESVGLANLGPARIKCALLSLKTLKLGIYSYLLEKFGPDDADKFKDYSSKLF